MKNKNSKIWTIIRHEFLTKVKSKGFIIGTLLAPIAILAMITIPALVAILSDKTTEVKLAIVDRTNFVGKELVKIDPKKYYLESKALDVLKKDMLNGSLDAYILIPENFLNNNEIDLYTVGKGGLGFLTKLESNLNNIYQNQKLKEFKINDETINQIDKRVTVNTQKVTEEGTKKDASEIYPIIGYILGFTIYIMMFIYGAFVMRGVIEEKANRIVEVLASSAKPFEIMFGKVVGIGAVGLTQVSIWAIFSVIIFSLAPVILGMFMDNNTAMNAMQAQTNGNPDKAEIIGLLNSISIPPMAIVGFLFYFLSGYFIYSALFAAVGSAVDQEQDAQQLQQPITLPLIIPILFVSYVIQNPDGIWSVILSLFPLFTPIIMTVRIFATSVPIWQIVLSVILEIGTFLFVLWFAGKVYRVGILMYGKKPSLKDLIKWFRLAK